MNASYTKTINELVDYLNVCRDQYYNNNNSLITDKQYDDLFDELKKLEEESGIILANSPTQSVGYSVVDGLEKVEHIRPLLSLDKTKDYEDVVKFCADKDVLFMHKLDGLTIDITYKDGKLFRAETRGDGYTGEDITHNAYTFFGVPKTIPYDKEIHIVGEAIITTDDFEYINSKLSDDEKYATARNLASGSVRQLSSAICAERRIRFIVWNANDISENGTMTNGLDNADNLGFITVTRYKRMLMANMKKDKIEELFINLKENANRNHIPIDGIVIMYNNIEYGKSLGKTAHHFRNGLAFKFYDDTYETNLRDIKYSIGKTGVLTPVAIFDAVDIDGTSVKQASLSNLSVLEETLGVPFLGETIYVSKRNAVIPKVESADIDGIQPNSKQFEVPSKCYCCGCDTVVKESKDGVKTLVCANTMCKGTIIKKLSAFVSKQAMNIDGLSEKTIEKLVDMGWLKNYSDIYIEIPNRAQKIADMPGFGDQSVSELLKSIETSKKTTLSNLLIGMNIDKIGKQTAKELETFFNGDYSNILNADINNVRNSLSKIKGFGDILVDCVCDWISNKDNMEEFKKLCSLMEFKTKIISDESKLSGMKFVITGGLNIYKNRDELVRVIEENGGTVQSSVSSETTYLINNDINSSSSKNTKAKKLGKPIITEQQFVNMISGGDTIATKPERKSLF